MDKANDWRTHEISKIQTAYTCTKFQAFVPLEEPAVELFLSCLKMGDFEGLRDVINVYTVSLLRCCSAVDELIFNFFIIISSFEEDT